MSGALVFDRAPLIPRHEVPKEEQESVYYLEIALNDLGHRCTEMAAAVALFERSEIELKGLGFRDPAFKLCTSWMHMAAREVAAAIFKFEEDLAALSENLRQCPSLHPRIDASTRRIAGKLFHSFFPDFKAARHPGQHGGLYATPARAAKHARGGQLWINNLFGSTLVTTFEKKEIRLDITQMTVARLTKVRDLQWKAFRPLDPFAERDAQLAAFARQFEDRNGHQ